MRHIACHVKLRLAQRNKAEIWNQLNYIFHDDFLPGSREALDNTLRSESDWNRKNLIGSAPPPIITYLIRYTCIYLTLIPTQFANLPLRLPPSETHGDVMGECNVT